MKSYLKALALAAALAFVAVAIPASSAENDNESTARTKIKVKEIRCKIDKQVCSIKCKKDGTCKTKCAQTEKTCIKDASLPPKAEPPKTK